MFANAYPIAGVSGFSFGARQLCGETIFASGQFRAEQVLPVSGDGVFEGDETFALRLTNVLNGQMGANVSATATILDDEVTQVTIATQSFSVVVEEDQGSEAV